MKATIATVTLGGPLMDKIHAAAEAGFECIELFDADLSDFDGGPAEAGRAVRDLGLTLLDYFPLRDFEGMPASRRTEVMERAERYLDRTAEMGAGMVMVCSNTDPGSSPDADRIATDLHDLGDLAAGRGLNIAYEALAWGRHVHDYRIAWNCVAAADHPRVGIVLDTFHIFSRGIDTSAIIDIPPERIFLVQVSDAPILDLDHMTWSRHHRNLPGRGAFPLGDFMAVLRSTGYDGIVSLECFCDELRTAPAGTVAMAGKRALDALLSVGSSAQGG